MYAHLLIAPMDNGQIGEHVVQRVELEECKEQDPQIGMQCVVAPIALLVPQLKRLPVTQTFVLLIALLPVGQVGLLALRLVLLVEHNIELRIYYREIYMEVLHVE